MPNSMKLSVLALITILFIFLFIGIGLDSSNYGYFLSRRVPKVLAMILASLAVAQSSLVFQTITHNRILTPSVMGFDALYLLVQVLVVVIFGSFSVFALNPFINFALSVVVMIGFSLLLFGFYFTKNNNNVMVLLLIGVILGQLFSNISSFFMMILDPNDFLSIQSAMFASFNNINKDLTYFCLLPLMAISVTLFRMSNVLDVFWLDNDNAISLGVDVRRVSQKVLILVAMLVSISTALIGPVMFFGLLVANLAKEFFNTHQHRT